MNPAAGQQRLAGWRILIAGAGGQGVLTVARLLSDCFVQRGHDVVSGQVHGMAQRGGSVQSSIIIDGGISPVIPAGRADVVLGFEPIETVRALPFMSPRTVVLMNTAPVIPFVLAQAAVLKGGDGRYPNVRGLQKRIEDVTPNVCAIDAARLAEQAGAVQALNMVMLGCLLGSDLLPCSAEDFWNAAVGRIPVAWRAINAAAFREGVDCAARLPVGGASR